MIKARIAGAFYLIGEGALTLWLLVAGVSVPRSIYS